jgi:hypothetical protein
MPLTPTPLYCSKCDCQQIKIRKSYTLKRSSLTPMRLELNGTSAPGGSHGLPF